MKDWSELLVMGRYEDGSDIVLPVPGFQGAHWLVGGATHAGKTHAIRLMLAQLVHLLGPAVAPVISDPHLLGFRRWENSAPVLYYGPRNTVPLLALIEDEMERRYDLLKDADQDEWTPDLADWLPYIVATFDEVASITLFDSGAMRRLIALAQEARKSGIGLVIAAQSPKVKVIDNMVREQCPIRIGLRMEEPEGTEAILGSSKYPLHEPANPAGIPLKMRGGCYVRDGYTIRRGRVDGLRPETERVLIGRYADQAPDLGWPHRVRHPREAPVAPVRSKRAASAGR